MKPRPMGITKRRYTILNMATAQGKSSRQIASELNISLSTVNNTLRDTYEILGVNNRIEAYRALYG